MSLVNQMLRDLEARREREEAATVRVEVQAVGTRRRRAWWPVAIAGVVVAVGAAAYVGSFVGKRVNHVELSSSSSRAPVLPSPAATGARGERSVPGNVNSRPQTHDFGHPQADRSPAGRGAKDVAPAEKTAPVTVSAKSHSAAPDPVTAQPAALITKQPAPQPHAAVTAHPRMNKTPHPPTPAERAAAAYAAGVEAAQRGEIAQAVAQFEAALNADPTAYGARQALAGLLDRQGRAQEAMQVFITGMQVDPVHRGLFARLYARLLVAHDQVGQAIAVLKDALPTAAEVPEHYAFLAALLERAGEHQAAIANYMKALAVRPDAGRWWAGVAVSYEQSREPDKALAAYQRARRAGGLGVTLAAYVNTRIDALTP